MARLPDIPQNWNDHFAAPQRADLDLNIGSAGLLGGWRQPDWNLENSGLGLVLPLETLARIDFGDRSPAAQADTLAESVPYSNVHDTLAALGVKPGHGFSPADQGAQIQLAAGNDNSYRPSKRRAEEYRGPTYNPRGIGPNASNPTRPRDFGTSESVPDAKAGFLGALQSFVEPFVDAKKLFYQTKIQKQFDDNGGVSKMEPRSFVGEDIGQYYSRPGYKDRNGGFWVDRNFDGSVDEHIFFKNGIEFRDYGTGIQRWKPNNRPPFPPPPVNKRYDGS